MSAPVAEYGRIANITYGDGSILAFVTIVNCQIGRHVGNRVKPNHILMSRISDIHQPKCDCGPTMTEPTIPNHPQWCHMQ